MNKEAENTSSHFLKPDKGKAKSNAIEIPAISLPKGGGAIKGIDEKFSVNAVNGTASFSIPLPFSKARGANPELNLSYNSGAGNSVFGIGWNIDLKSIKRQTGRQLPQYSDLNDSDTFLLSDAEDLVAEFKKGSNGSFVKDADGNYIIHEKDAPGTQFTIRFYKPRIEGLFARIERWRHKTTGEIKWRVITKENVTTLFGWSAASRICAPNDVNKIFEWLPEFVFDDKGNCIQYRYKPEDDTGFNTALLHNKNRIKNGKLTYSNLYLEKILYGNRTPYKGFNDERPAPTDYLFETIFDYGEYDVNAPYTKIKNWDFRTDACSDYKPGFEIRNTRLCKRVLLFHHFDELPGGSALVRSLNLEYDASSEEDFTFLKSITSYGYIKQTNGTYTHKSLPPVEFKYQQHHWSKEVKSIPQADVVQVRVGPEDPTYQFTDLFNEGLAGILSEQAGTWYYKRNLGQGHFEQAKPLSSKPSVKGLGYQWQLADLDADGRKQLVCYAAHPNGYFELDDDEWQGMRSFKSLPNIDFRDGNTRMLDLDGDGRPEIVVSEERVFTWYQSDGRNGYSQAHKVPKALTEDEGPQVVFADAKQSIFLADMSGDGMTDIVRIRNGEVCYWPNLGYGKFGAKRNLDNAPVFDHPDAFIPGAIRLADINGSGTSDIVYLGKNKFTCWTNLSGNRFSTKPFEIENFDGIHSHTRITVTDLLGNGMGCIVWSSPLLKHNTAPLRYIDLVNSKKPHILIGYKNNMGKEVSLEYTPSTHFYLEDKKAGKAWVTKLHFPIHCVTKTIIEDKISGHKFVTEYKYHHGYYDHAEREFRGFGMVEQLDAESFEHWQKGTENNIVEEPLHQDPIVTRTWYHTGAFLKKEKILDLFAKDYWHEEMHRQGFPVTHYEAPLADAKFVVAPGMDGSMLDHMGAREWKEAYRACKGLELRSEVFAKDAKKHGDTKEAKRTALTPFTVATHNCIIELLQPKGKNKHAIFKVIKSETRTYNYERNTADPRIAHTLTIRSDEYGNELGTAAIVYPRMQADVSLPLATQQAQNKTMILYTQKTFTNDVIGDNEYRLRAKAEAKTYELTGISKTGPYYAVGDLENIPSSQKKLLEHTRNIFYRNDLKGALPLNQLESKGISFETYQLAYTPELLYDIFGTKVNGAILTEGGFTNIDNNWWVRSGTTQFITDNETAADAQSRFYTPIAYTDPFGAVTKVKHYGNYFLFIDQTEDALGNKASVDLFNFRTLSPRRMRCFNNNISETITDELGMVKAMAVFGKGYEADDLEGLNEFTTDAEKELITDFFDASVHLGKILLQHATARFVYDFDAYTNHGKPLTVASIVREEHHQTNNDSPVQLSFEYTNALGKVIMTKKQAAEQFQWIGNGRTVLNNKGNAVKQYEPYFSSTHRYEDAKELVETGSTPKLYYDAGGRLIKKEMPDGTFATINFTSWKQDSYDANDNILASSWYTNRSNRLIDDQLIAEGKDPLREKQAADRSAKHANTPDVQHFDTLGRPVLTVEHNRNSTGADELYCTSIQLDAAGNLRTVTDARGNVAMEYKYDMLGNMVYQKSMDAGTRWLLRNAVDQPLRTWDERGHEFQYFYDILHRSTHSVVVSNDQSNVFDRIVYGEDLLDNTNKPVLQARNVLGKKVQHYDTGGLVETPNYDFNDHAITTTRRLFKKYKEVANWRGSNLQTDLELESYTFTSETDALKRTTRQTAPDGSITTFLYNGAGLLNSATIGDTTYIKEIGYNEKGQRNKIIYGNDVVTRFYYDKETFKLTRLVTKQQNKALQDWRYTYDPAGNITHIENKNIKEKFFDNSKISAVTEYIYDALYRLVEATGKENNASLSFNGTDNWNDAAFMQAIHPGDPMAMRNYTQQYQYDCVGNILQMRHHAQGNNWTRSYHYSAGSNRLAGTQTGKEIHTYPHHAQHGFITAMPHLEELAWNFKEELVKTIRQKRTDGGTPETTYYQYDGEGKRLRKITENQSAPGETPSIKEQRIYISNFELYKDHTGLERTSLSLQEGDHRFVIIETRNHVDDGTEQQLVRYQLHNHLGSAALELDSTAQVISYEEYHPYGTTAYQAKNAAIRSAAKRYRYTGMERDEESGFEYHSTRYYLPWLARWLSCDPLFKEKQITKPAEKEDNKKETESTPLRFKEGSDDKQEKEPEKKEQKSEKDPRANHKELCELKNLNLYAYCSLNPIIYYDPSGNLGIMQWFTDTWNKPTTTTGEKVALGFLFIFAYLAHVVINLFLLVLFAVIQPMFWNDWSWGAIQSSLGLGIGAIFVLLGGDVTPRWGMGNVVKAHSWMGRIGGISFGPTIITSSTFKDAPHEWGHTWQSRVLGPFYLLVVGIPSLISAATQSYADHKKFYTERWADAWAY